MLKEIKPPFKTNVTDVQDLQNFDTYFTLEEARDSVVAATVGKADTSNFDGFTFVPKNNLGGSSRPLWRQVRQGTEERE